MNFDNVLDLFAYWLLNGECLSGRDAGGLNSGEEVVAGECKGIKKSGKANLFISDEMERMKRIYVEDLTPTHRKAIALEYGLSGSRDNRTRTSTERRRLHDAKKRFYLKYIERVKPQRNRRNSILFFC